MFWTIAGILFAIFVLLGLCGMIFEKKGNKKSDNKISDLKRKHMIDIGAISRGGAWAFSDSEKTLYIYKNFNDSTETIGYNTILKYEKDPAIDGISIWTYSKEYNEYMSGDVGADNLKKFIDKLKVIISDNTSRAKNEYELITEIPVSAPKLSVKGFDGDIRSYCSDNEIIFTKHMYFWLENNSVNLMPVFDCIEHYVRFRQTYKLIAIDKKNIVDIVQDGSVHYSTEVSGGGGGGSSLKGAVIGGVIAGEAGAVIGSRKKTDPITSTTKQIDDRVTRLKILSDSNSLCEIDFDYNDFYVLKKIIAIE